MRFNPSAALALQVLSYKPPDMQVSWGSLQRPLLTIRQGRCVVCDCSTFRHREGPLPNVIQCKHPCPSSTIRAHNSKDLAGISLPQLCGPGVQAPGELGGPVRLQINEETTGFEAVLEAPVVTTPKRQGQLTQAAREIMYDRQENRCNGCFMRFSLDDLTDDHRIPKSRGGLKVIGNIELMCATCNTREKKSQDMYTFLWSRHGQAITQWVSTS